MDWKNYLMPLPINKVQPWSPQQPQMQEEEPYKPQTAIYDELLNSLRNPPERNNPSGWRRLGAYIAGLGGGADAQAIVGGQPIGFDYDAEKGRAATEQFLYAPYFRDLQDYTMRNELLAPAAKIEGDMNQQNRLLFDAKQDRILRERGIQRQEDRDDDIRTKEAAATTVAQGKLADTQARTELMRLKQANPAMRFFDYGNQVIAVNPVTGESQVVTGPDGQPIDGRNVSAAERLNMQFGNSKELESIRQRNRESIEGQRQENRIELKETPAPPRPSSATGNSQLEKQRQLFSKAKQLKDTNPELGKFIVLGTGNNFSIKSTGMFSGPTKAQRDQITREVYGISEPGMDRNSTSTQTSTGRVIIYKNGKAVGTIPADQKQQAIDEGYEVR